MTADVTDAPRTPAAVRSAILPVIEQQVAVLEPTLARVCRYHLGLVDEHGAPSRRGDGKLTRAGLLLAAAEGAGLPVRDVQAHAAALELMHNATLVHDDIIDDDDLRRGRPAAWKVFGTGLAVLAGNALENRGLRIVVDDSGPGHAEIAAGYTEAIGLVHEGQARELVFRPDTGDSVAEYGRIVAGKAGALLECALVTPAVRAGRSKDTLTALREAGQSLGAALQTANDVEDIWGDTAVTGKPDRGDLRRRNPTLPVVLVLSGPGPVAERLGRLWRADDTTDDHVRAMADLIEEAGARRTAEDLARRHLDLALEHLRRAELTPAATTELATMFDRIVNRTA